MALVSDMDGGSYESSDESSESDLLDRSLSVWRGWQRGDEPDFSPVPLDPHTAASIGQYDCVWNIIQRGEADINRKNIGGWTPLMYACYIGHETIVNLLIDAGTSVNVKNSKGQTPLMLAASCGNESVAYFLIQADGDLEARDKKGWTALFHATYSGHQNMVKYLLDSKANPEAKEPFNEFTPFMEAASAGHEIIVQCFLQHGIEVNAKSLSGDTARSIAMATGYTKIVSLIDNHLLGPTHSLRPEPGLDRDFGSSDEDFQNPHRPPRPRKKIGPSIKEGPAAFAEMLHKMKNKKDGTGTTSSDDSSDLVPTGYIQFSGTGKYPGETPALTSRDIISPIRPDDHKEILDPNDSAFLRTGAMTIKSSGSSSSGGLMNAAGISRDSSVDSADDYDSRSVSSDPGGHRSHTDDPQGHVRSHQLPAGRPILGKTFADGIIPHQMGMHQVHSAPDISDNHTGETQPHITTPTNTSVRPPPGFTHIATSNNNTNQGHTPPLLSQHQQQTTLAGGGKNTQGYTSPFTHASQQVTYGQLPQLLGNLSTTEHQQHGHNNNKPMVTMGTSIQQNPHNLKYNSNNNENVNNTNSVVSTPASGKGDGPEGGTGVKGGGPVSSGFSDKARQEQAQMLESRPHDLETLLEELSLSKYMQVFEEQDVDLQVFLTLTDNDLKEVGIKLFGPRRKMTQSISRWHINAKPASQDLEQAFADKLLAEVTETGVQLTQTKDECESLRHQLLQEQELRSVTEGALMEDRVAWQQVHRIATDTRHRCDNLNDILTNINIYQSELVRRFGAESPFSRSGSHGQERLAEALKDKLLLAQQEQGVPTEMNRMPTNQIIRRLQHWYDQLATLVPMITANTDKLLGRDMAQVQQAGSET